MFSRGQNIGSARQVAGTGTRAHGRTRGAVRAPPVQAQTTAVLQGRVVDESGAVSRRPDPRARRLDRFRRVRRHRSRRALPHPRDSRRQVQRLVRRRPDFGPSVIEALDVDVGRTLVRDFRPGRRPSKARPWSSARRCRWSIVRRPPWGTSSPDRPSSEIPLNGRHFTDLGLLVPGSVAPSQAGFSSRPIRGIGTLAFNTAGNREERSAFLVNGVSTNNQTFGSLVYEPPLGSIQEFKVDNSGIAAEHGHVSGAIVNLVTRSGTDAIHGDVFEFFRDDALDARNFFEFTTPDPHPFRRNQFGGSLGGPIRRGRTFYFASYEGFRQRQGVDLNSLVLSDAAARRA